MKKLTTLFGLLFCASVVLTSCGGAEADGIKYGECLCDAYNSDDAEKAEEECEEMYKKHVDKYEGNEEDEKAYEKGFEKAEEDCEE